MTDYNIHFYDKYYTVVNMVYKGTALRYEFYNQSAKIVLASYDKAGVDFGKVYGYCVKYGKRIEEDSQEEATLQEKNNRAMASQR